ncbi:MAG: carboxypeptidase regulatory-like domain-containing protein [Kofleriaceae bacterium]
MKTRSTSIAAFVVAIAAIAGGIWWWTSRGGEPASPAQPTIAASPAAGSAAAAPARPGAAATARLVVEVRDARGPIAGAAVRLAPEDGEAIALETGADGIARADQLAPGAWDISASAADHLPAAAPRQQLRGGEEGRVALTLEAGGRLLTGVVTDASGGPIAGARIDAAKLDAARPGRAIATTFTGGDGRYRLSVAVGTLLVAARSPDYAAQSRFVEVGASGATADFALVPGGVVEGVVLDETSRQPVPGAEVEAQRQSAAIQLAEARSHRATAGPDGRFRLTGLRPGTYELGAQLGALRAHAPTLVGIGVAEQLPDVVILVGRGPTIRGKVVDERDAPIAGATVSAMGPGRDRTARSDATGAFALEGVPPGKHFLIARSDRHVGGGTPVVVERADVEGVVLKMRAGAVLRGHVEPRQVAHVSFERELGVMNLANHVAPITTGADGAFEISPIEPGAATLTAQCPSGDQGTLALEVVEGMPEVVVKLTPGGELAGRVVDGENKPVAGVSVLAMPEGPRETTRIVNGLITSGVQAISGGDGAFELLGLAPGSYRLVATDRGRPLRSRGKPPTATLAAGERKTGVVVAIDRANGVISGVVLGPDGKPLADAWVSVHQTFGAMLEGVLGNSDEPAGGGSGAPATRMVRVEAADSAEGGAGGANAFPPALTDERGAFSIGGLPHSKFDVFAEARAGKLRGRATGIEPDATVTIRAAGLSRLSGTVRGPAGPARLFTVELDGPTTAQRTFTDGTFELGRIDPGRYTVRVRSSEGNGEAVVQVAADTPATVDIVLVSNAIVVGALADAGGKPLAGVPVLVVPDQGDRFQFSFDGPPPTSGPDGTFRIEHQAGKSALVVLAPGEPVIRRGLALEAGKVLDVGTVQIGGPPAAP